MATETLNTGTQTGAEVAIEDAATFFVRLDGSTPGSNNFGGAWVALESRQTGEDDTFWQVIETFKTNMQRGDTSPAPMDYRFRVVKEGEAGYSVDATIT